MLSGIERALLRQLVLRIHGATAFVDYPYHPRPRLSPEVAGMRFVVEAIEHQEGNYLDLLEQFSSYTPLLNSIPGETDSNPRRPFWNNLWIPALDAITLYGLVAVFKPRIYMEVGSGESTKFVKRSIHDHGLNTRVISIDPDPRDEIDEICDDVIRVALEDCDTNIFRRLKHNDVLFVDNSHRAFTNSDVTVFFTEVLPQLASGVIYGLHDIFLPYDYPEEWNDRYYNEQYLLYAYLLGGARGDEIVFPSAYVARSPKDSQLYAAAAALFREGPLAELRGTRPPLFDGGCFWMRRNPDL